ncbi:MAG TPA: trypsin-like peptidase domain-containing protein [Candidatus Hydrogenedentes bacterium]|nr:trypsin-like peptidase domain-containing protein [Candidatus Hydrogenedentota bacterium]HPG69015.1 trypsin-like peptidase domain-containing protein [Candidatus Hydrogenedentota bacterium]
MVSLSVWKTRPRFCRVACVPLAFVVFCSLAAGQAESNLPDPGQVLRAHGLDAAACQVLVTWHERLRDGEGPLVIGCRVLRESGVAPVDIYTDADGNPIDNNGLRAMGMHAKRWGDTHRWQGPSSSGGPKLLIPPPRPVSAAARTGPSAFVGLGQIDIERVLEEDASGESTAEKGLARTGVFQDLAQPISIDGATVSDGAWEALADGAHLWAGTIYSPEAVGQRVHFGRLELPAGARVVVYNLLDPTECYGPFVGPPPDESDLWTPTCFADAVTIECYVPGDVSLDTVHIKIDRIVHHYLKFEDWPGLKAAGTCNLDVGCDSGWPDTVSDTAARWATTALGVGGIGTIGSAGSLWCTGTLIADSDPETDTPYFLTANHCVGSASKASSIEIYWRYQRPACGESVPSPATVPRTTGGADYLAGSYYSTGNDFTFLRLRNDPPAGITFVGWSGAAPDTGIGIVCVHHPNGDYKRITFGTLTNVTDPCGYSPPSRERYHQASWYAGTTEHGSSGSPLLDASQQRIIGQLYGGYASCAQPQCCDYYGRFDLTYPVVETWLAASHDPYDVDFSGTVDAADLQAVVNAALGITPLASADVDDSGLVDAVDVQLLIIALLEPTE